MQKAIIKLTWIVSYFIIWPITRLVWPIKIVVSKSAAKIKGPVIIISNHKSFLDPWIIASAIPFKIFLKILPIRILGGREYGSFFLTFLDKLKIIPLIYYIYGVIDIRKEWSFEEKTQPLIDAANHCQSVFIFPEGGLHQDDGLGLFKRGVSYIYAQSGVSILPCSVNFNQQFHCTVHIGPPTAIPEKIITPENRPNSFYQKSCRYLKEKVRRMYRML